MEARRMTRGRPVISASEPPRTRSPGRKSPARKSPSRRTRTPVPKSPSRNKSPIIMKSPARKSPTRRSTPPAPARKSPARTKSPSRKKPTATVPPTSPMKEAKEKAEKKTSPPLTAVSRPPINPSPIKRDLKESSSLQSVSSYSSSTRTTIKTTATVDTIDIGQNKSSDISGDLEVSKLTSLAAFIRRSVSKNPTPTTELTRQSRSISRSVYDDDYSKTEYSDAEQDNYETIHADSSLNAYAKRSIARQIEVPKEFGGAIGAAILLLLIPPATFYLQYSCDTKPCRFKCVNLLLTTFESISSLFDSIATGGYVSFVILVQLLSAFPFGRVVLMHNDRGTLQYYFNSILSTFVVVLALGTGEFLKYPVVDFIWKNSLKFSLLSILMALALSLCCFMRSRSISPNLLNPYGKSGNFFIDFFIGREITPKWFGIVDIKLACYRISLISTFILSLVMIWKNVRFPALPSKEGTLSFPDSAKYLYDNVKFDSSALFASVLLVIYVVDLIINEHHLASSFDLQQEGVGAMLLLRYAIIPFLLALVPRYALTNKIHIPLWGYGLISVVFIAGLIIKRASNSIKYQYRMNPNQSNFIMMDTVPTFQGKRLLLDKWWGCVRQPNYIGDIISLIAYSGLLSWNCAWPPAISILLIVLFLIHRAIRVNARNFRRYNSAWSRYCTRVRYLLVPKVF